MQRAPPPTGHSSSRSAFVPPPLLSRLRHRLFFILPAKFANDVGHVFERFRNLGDATFFIDAAGSCVVSPQDERQIVVVLVQEQLEQLGSRFYVLLRIERVLHFHLARGGR